MTDLLSINEEFSVLETFDYGSLEPATAALARDIATAISLHLVTTTEAAIQIGAMLISVKSKLQHGDFAKWIHSEFKWTERTAQNFMRASQVYGGKAKLVSYLPPTTIYKLQAPSVPSAAREEVFQRLNQGERPDPLTIGAIIEAARQAEQETRKTPEQREKERLAKAKADRASARRKAEWAKQDEQRALERLGEEAASKTAADLVAKHMPSAVGEFAALLEKTSLHLFLQELRSLRGGASS